MVNLWILVCWQLGCGDMMPSFSKSASCLARMQHIHSSGQISAKRSKLSVPIPENRQGTLIAACRDGFKAYTLFGMLSPPRIQNSGAVLGRKLGSRTTHCSTFLLGY
eukprot:6088896-Amphidinium_carterae.1